MIPKIARRGEVLEVRVVEDDDEVALGHDRADAADDERHRERPDERVDPEPGDDDAVGEADGQADAEGRRDPDRRAHPRPRAGRPSRRRGRRSHRPTGRCRRRSGRASRRTATMMIPACWSRMLARFWNRRNDGLTRLSDDEHDDERDDDPALPDGPPQPGQDRRRQATSPRSRARRSCLRPPASAPNAAARIASSVMPVPVELRDDPTGAHDEHAMARGRGSPRSRWRSAGPPTPPDASSTRSW